MTVNRALDLARTVPVGNRRPEAGLLNEARDDVQREVA